MGYYSVRDHLADVGAVVRTARLPKGTWAMTDGATIWVDERLGDHCRRSAIAHELVHIEHGHQAPQPEPVEIIVRRLTAGRLISPSAVTEAAQAASERGGSLRDWARELRVSPLVLRDWVELCQGPEMPATLAAPTTTPSALTGAWACPGGA